MNASTSGIRTDIFRSILGLVLSVNERHGKMFVFRFDLSVNEHTQNNGLIEHLVRRLSRRVKTHYKAKLFYFWVREQEKAKKQHYHFFVILDGSKINRPNQLQEWIRTIWEQYGRCHWSAYHNVSRQDTNSLRDVVYHLSYLAKSRGKGYRAAQVKDFGHSKGFV